MDVLVVTALAMSWVPSSARAPASGVHRFCDATKVPLEVGAWSRGLERLDSAAIDNPPVSASEGQVYVYENLFQDYLIKYIQVDNLAKKSCGASASIKAGGYNSSGVLIVLQASPYQEIRSVIDIWGVRAPPAPPDRRLRTLSPGDIKDMKNIKSKYLLSLRAVNHNFDPENGKQNGYFY